MITTGCTPGDTRGCLSAAANSCGLQGVGTETCQSDGTWPSSCPASPPAAPTNFGNQCDSKPNNCGTVGIGTIQCDGSCSAVQPPNNTFSFFCPSGVTGVRVTPNPATIPLGRSQPFTGAVSGPQVWNSAVTWSVNGVAGGNATVGTINATGWYYPPVTVPSPATVTVTAASVQDSTVSGSANATITLGASVSLSASPASGPTPLTTTLTSNVTTTDVTDTLNYSIFFDCSYAGTDLSIAEATCGSLPAPNPGSCTVNSIGEKCDATTTLSLPISATYSAVNTYNPKVIVEQGSNSPVTATTPVVAKAGVMAPTLPASREPVLWSWAPVRTIVPPVRS